MSFATQFVADRIDYDGTQLASLFAYRTAGVSGDSIISFTGACRVPTGNMVDQEDVVAGGFIESPDMLHFICELFGTDLTSMVLHQRLFGWLVADQIAELGVTRPTVRGDDLFLDRRKLTVSIATVSPVSALFHFGMNIRTEGAPVPAIGLNELELDPEEFGRRMLDRFQAEEEGVRHATSKVRWVQ